MLLIRLAELREIKGFSYEQLAVKASVSSMTIRRAEKGRGVVLNNAKAIAKALGVKLEELL